MTSSKNSAHAKIKIRTATCAVCGGDRNCRIRGHCRKSDTFEHITGWTDWYLLQCRGCDYVFTQQVSGNSEDWHFTGESGDYSMIEHDETFTYFPALSSRNKPEWMSDYGMDIPGERQLDENLTELYKALDAGLNRLAGIGIRTCFDIASGSLGVDSNLTFPGKLGELVKQGHIGAADQDHVNVLIQAGNASAHQGWKPSAEQLDTLMRVLEHFIFSAFIMPARREKLDKEMKAMAAEVPKRRDRK